jgi:hypothetical protein
MILPDKNITLHYSILGMGTKMLLEVNTPQTVSSLWEKLRECDEINTFEKFTLRACQKITYQIFKHIQFQNPFSVE